MKVLSILFALCISTFPLFAQAPAGINYQAVARDGQGAILVNKNLNVQFSIRSGSATGTIEYQETHFVNTNDFGLFNAVIGEGNAVSGNFSTLDWSNNKFFLQVEVDPGSGMVDLGTTQLVSVPYALYAKQAGSSVNNDWSSLSNVPAGFADGTDDVNDADSDPNNEIQSLSLAGTNLTISQGNTVTLPGSNSPWYVNGNNIYYNTGNVGIGTMPKTTLHVEDGQRVLFGADTMGSGDKLMWLPDLHAFRVGTLTIGAYSYWDRDSIGLYSFATGLNTRAQSYGATAFGDQSMASGDQAFASGYASYAKGWASTAMGYRSQALAKGSTALGYFTNAINPYSFSAGYYAEAQAYYSVAIGAGVRAQSYASMAVGQYNIGGGSATSWNSSDPIFEVGIGTYNGNRANAITVRKDGNVGIGVYNPGESLVIGGSADPVIQIGGLQIGDLGTSNLGLDGDIVPYNGSSFQFDIGNNNSTEHWDDVVADDFINFSDKRIKQDIAPMPYGLSELMQLKTYKYRLLPEYDLAQDDRLGLMAQDLLSIIPEAVVTEDVDTDLKTGKIVRKPLEVMGVKYMTLIPVLINALQEEEQKRSQLEASVKQQAEQIKAMEQRLEQLEQNR